MASSTLNFQVQHQVANDVKFIYSRPIYGEPIQPILNVPIGIPVQLLQNCLVLEKADCATIC